MFLMYFSATKYIIMCKDTFLFGISVRYVPLFSFSVHAVALANAPQSLLHRNGMTFSLHRVAFPRHSFCRHNTTALILQCQAYNTPVPNFGTPVPLYMVSLWYCEQETTSFG